MYFLFSGEGATDLGACAHGALTCEAEEYHHGPMTVVVDQIVDQRHHYSLLEAGCYGFASRHALIVQAAELKAARKSLGLPGKRRSRETRYFFNNARVMARIAAQRQRTLRDDVVAVLFRDADTATAGRGAWPQKWRSILDGFEEEGFRRGVPMIPKPSSEAWLLCALKEQPYQNCASLEERSGGSRSSRSLKADLTRWLGHSPSREELCQMLGDRTVDINRIDMPSFVAFRSRLDAVI